MMMTHKKLQRNGKSWRRTTWIIASICIVSAIIGKYISSIFGYFSNDYTTTVTLPFVTTGILSFDGMIANKVPPIPHALSQSISQTILNEHKASLLYYGTQATNTGWYVDTTCLKNKVSLLVYGVGVGEDISWDTGLIDTYNAEVYVFDPTEKSLKYTKPLLEKYRGKLSHIPEGLSDVPGTLTFALPANPDHVSMRQVELATKDMVHTVTVPVNTLLAWMEHHSHTYLDIFKIDIEGSEYAVLESLLAQNFMPFTQLLIEYHDRFLSDKSRHSKLIKALQDAGFYELWSGHGGQEIGYIKLADLSYCHDGVSPRSPKISKIDILN